MIIVRPSIVDMPVIVVKSNYRNTGTKLIGSTGTVIGYNGDAKQNIKVEFPDGSQLWFDADELEEVKPVIVEEKQ